MSSAQIYSLVRPVVLWAVLLASATCSSGDSGSDDGKIVEAKTATAVSITQTLVLGAGTAFETRVDVPPGAAADGKEIKVVVKSGVPFGTYDSDAALDVGPPDLVLVNPLRMRRRVAVAPPRQRYIAVQNNPSTGSTVVKSGARRIFDPAAPDDAQTELWEADVDAPGVWGLALDPMTLGKSDDGTDLQDSVTIFETEQVQNLLVGPAGDRRIVTVPAAMPMAAAFPGPVVDPRVSDRSVLLYESKGFAQVSRQRSPVVAEVVAAPAPIAPRSVPISDTVMRLRPPPLQPGPPMRSRVLTVTQTIPPPSPRMVDVVPPPVPPVLRSATPAGPFVEPTPPVTVTRSRVAVPGATPRVLPFEYSQPVDDLWYGLGVSADDVVVNPDGGVPDAGSVTPGPDGGVVPPLPDAGPIVSMGALVAEPTSLNLGSSAKGIMSVAKKVTIRNPSNQSSGSMSYSFVGGDASQFALENSNCPSQIGPGEICELFIAFTPTGAKTLTTTLRAKGSVAGTTDVAIMALGTASKLVVNLAEHDFGNIKVGDTGVIVLMYTNEGNSSTLGQTFYGSGDAGNAYEVVDGCYGKDMVAGERCNVSIKYKPTETGITSMLVEFRTARDNSSAFTMLMGTGVP
ncbi:MAG: choice-of-anchor D domain-containing protein [Deltaproteobacteria bacterium]|nr:choice-of-anchor D domain-containing protein [Deltaproteobacteria bacterium]